MDAYRREAMAIIARWDLADQLDGQGRGMKPTLLSLLRGGKHSIRDMAKILGISKSKVSWFIAQLERRKWVEVTGAQYISTMNPFQQAERIQG